LATVTASGPASRPLRTALRLSWRDWWTMAEATLLLALARIAVLLVRFSVLARRLGVHMRESTHDDDPAQRPALRRIRWALGAVSRRAPWRCKCLERALAAKVMLRLRGIRSTLYLGVAREPGEEVQAHAWVRCGSFYVTGGEERAKFTVVSMFADESAE
jgi:hypothetical protein